MDEEVDCLFCQITRGRDAKRKLYFFNDDYAVFSDLHPSSKHHFLVCPKTHIINAKVLKKEHLDMVEELVSIAKKVLSENGADMDDIRLGFHWPPFCSIHHLHLHAISPYTQTWKLLRKFGKYTDAPWFVTVDYVMERLKKM